MEYESVNIIRIGILNFRKDMNYYVVLAGRKTGIFLSWTECKASVNGFSKAKYKKFSTLDQAEAYYGKPYDDKLFNDAKPKYKHTDNCLLCGKPFKQRLAKGGRRKEKPVCFACNRKKRELLYSLHKRMEGRILRVTIDDLVYLKRLYHKDDIFTFLKQEPAAAFESVHRHSKETAHAALVKQRRTYSKDAKVSGIPVYITEFFGKDKEVASVKGDKRNPQIFYRCKKCGCDFSVSWNHYKKTQGHDCSGLLSTGEAIVADYLKRNNIAFTTQRDTFRCINPDTGHVMPYDFELTGKKVLIEVQGEQHRRFIERFHVDENGFEYQKQKDMYKRAIAESNGYAVLELWYDDFKDDTYINKIRDMISKGLV